MCARHYRIRGKVQAKPEEPLGDALPYHVIGTHACMTCSSLTSDL